MDDKRIEEIRGRFKNHIATLTEFDGVQVVRFAEPNTNNYSMNVIYQSNFVYISGDIGEAIYDTTWKTNYKNCSKVGSFGYFTGKLACVRWDKMKFEEQDCIDDLNEWKEEYLKDAEEFGYFKDNPSHKEELNMMVGNLMYNTEVQFMWLNELSKIDGDEFGIDFESSLWQAGERLNPRLELYFVALIMIQEYLDKED